ncbi:transposable element Tcb2 transposase [Trichonephila clavipes]|nr:transposable element Tcb2 transposase [Trichonephila clavipes]
MDDNCRPPRANLVEDFLFEEGIVRIEWSACSPDMNPIEHVWDALGRRVAGRQPPPTNSPRTGKSSSGRVGLVIKSLIDSMPQSCHASGIVVSDADCCAVGMGSNPGEIMDVSKCIVPLRHRGAINSRRGASPFVSNPSTVSRRNPSSTDRIPLVPASFATLLTYTDCNTMPSLVPDMERRSLPRFQRSHSPFVKSFREVGG